jgi:hypothetical protein
MDVFTIGEYVSLLKEEGKFKILSLQRDIAIIEDEYGFERTITLKELVKRREIPLPTNFQVKDSTQEQKAKAKNNSELPLVDLHMEMLEVPTNNMNTHDILLHQIHVFKKFTNKMIQQQQAKFIVIHGVGEGRLKNEIKLLVNGNNGLMMHDANYSNRGVGASLIEITKSKVSTF